MGLTTGTDSRVLHDPIPNGGQLVATALGSTGVGFAGLSGYVPVTRNDSGFIGDMLMVGILVAFLAALVTLIWPCLLSAWRFPRCSS